MSRNGIPFRLIVSCTLLRLRLHRTHKLVFTLKLGLQQVQKTRRVLALQWTKNRARAEELVLREIVCGE